MKTCFKCGHDAEHSSDAIAMHAGAQIDLSRYVDNKCHEEGCDCKITNKERDDLEENE